MSNQFFGSFKSAYVAAAAAAAAAAAPPPPPGVTIPSLYSRSLSTEQYHPESSALSYFSASDRLASPDATKHSLSSSLYLPDSDLNRYDYSAIAAKASAASGSHYLSQQSSWLGSDFGSAIKRPSEALYHQTVYGAHSTLGQSEAWYSANSLAKRPRLESASKLPIYPQRPGEKDCAYYMQTRTCKFGDSCKFDHPVWVPEGGIPDWKEVPPVSEDLPERPGEPDCPYYIKTKKCKFGVKCKFNHPKDENANTGAVENNTFNLPERPSEPECAFYMKTGKCKFGANCKFHHPKDIQIPAENGNGKQAISENNVVKTSDLPPAASGQIIAHNSKGLPMRLGVEDCPFYMKTGSCKYGISCRYNHPDRTAAINPPAAPIGHPLLAPQTPTLGFDVTNSAASLYQSIEPRFTQPALGGVATSYPQRPGQTECDFYMKTGECKFGDKCKFNHPIDRSAPIAKPGQPGVKLTPAGLPRREGATLCAYYLKTGTCKFGATCRFDHPPPGEVMAMATSQGTSTQQEPEVAKDQQAQG